MTPHQQVQPMTSRARLPAKPAASTPGHHEPARTRAGTGACCRLRRSTERVPPHRKSTHLGKPRQHKSRRTPGAFTRLNTPPGFPEYPGPFPNTPPGFPEYPGGVTGIPPSGPGNHGLPFRVSPFRPARACAGCGHPINLLHRQHIRRRPEPGPVFACYMPGPPAHRACPLGRTGPASPAARAMAPRERESTMTDAAPARGLAARLNRHRAASTAHRETPDTRRPLRRRPGPARGH
jgi:hypothetical protein